MDQQKLYAIQNPATGYVKIGIAAVPEERLKAIEFQSKCENLKILIVKEVKLARSSEAALHRKYEEYNVGQEWFDLSKEIMGELDEVFTKMQDYVPESYSDPLGMEPSYWCNVREDIQALFRRRGLDQASVAKEIGVTRGYLNSALRGKKAHVPKVWQKLFDKFDYELIVVPKDKVVTVKKALVD